MIISVINHTNNQIRDAELQRVIRAINRQIAEDFVPYWGMAATLRLEGRVGEKPAPENPADMRGDAVLYLWESADAADDALGYHEANLHGVPYGFVFIDLAKEVGEQWSVTLSHEALELLADPEVNLLVAGLHPEDPSKEVFHWYEVCDAVQDEAYAIDGIQVSNFVLPLYFTGEEERGGRNDFLGTQHAHGTLQSFGVNPGGYIGFYDPQTRTHTTYEGRTDERAAMRKRIRFRAAGARRAIRYQRHHAATRPTVRAVEAGPANVPGPQFEAFILEVHPGSRQRPQQVAKTIVTRVLGNGWRLRRFSADPHEFLVVQNGIVLSVGQAWELTYQFRAAREVVYAEPAFTLRLTGQHDWHDVPAETRERRRASFFEDRDDPETDNNYEWSLTQVHAREAWDLFADPVAQPGRNVIVGHPDTGYRDHYEIWSNQPGTLRIRIADGKDFVDGDNDALDELETDALIATPSHGTSTASVIMSDVGPDGGAHVTGIAPKAELIPIRVSKSVVLPPWSMPQLVRAIDHAVTKGAHVISISMGGLWSRALHKAVQRAQQAGIIVLAAAGNYVGFVVWPAAYDEVLAVAASNIKRRPWRHSSHGEAVDVTAPGESVWRAVTTLKPNNTVENTVGRGTGTSYAVATTAGIAALWLSFHVRDKLITRYGSAGAISAVFKEVLMTAGCDPGEGLDSDEYGAGIVNAKKVLQAALPPSAPARGMRALRMRAVSDDIGGLATFAHLCAGTPDTALRSVLCDLLTVPEQSLASRLDEVGEELAFYLATDTALRSSLTTAVGKARRAAALPGSITTETASVMRQALAAKGASKLLLTTLMGS